MRCAVNTGKVLAKLITDRFKTGYEAHIGEEQLGFLQNQSISDAIFITRMTIQNC